MALSEVVPLYPMRFRFRLYQLPWWDQLRVRLPVVCKIHFDVKPLEAFEQLAQRSSIAPSTFPVDELTCSTTIRLPDPEFVFFDVMKCHISSSSTITSPAGVGFSYVAAPNARTQSSTAFGETLTIDAIDRRESPVT
jgi:hypothetical protein